MIGTLFSQELGNLIPSWNQQRFSENTCQQSNENWLMISYEWLITYEWIRDWIYLGFVVSWSVTRTTVTTATTSTSAASTVVTSSARNWSWLEVNFLDTSSTALLGSFNLDVGSSFLKFEFVKQYFGRILSHLFYLLAGVWIAVWLFSLSIVFLKSQSFFFWFNWSWWSLFFFSSGSFNGWFFFSWFSLSLQIIFSSTPVSSTSTFTFIRSLVICSKSIRKKVWPLIYKSYGAISIYEIHLPCMSSLDHQIFYQTFGHHHVVLLGRVHVRHLLVCHLLLVVEHLRRFHRFATKI